MDTMKAERYIVRTETGRHVKELLWDPRAPLGLGAPFRWALERVDGGFYVRDLLYEPGKIQKGKRHKLHSTDVLELPDSIRLSIRPVPEISPPYVKMSSDAKAKTQLFVYSGIRQNIISAKAIHSSYIAYFESRPAFTLHFKQEGFQLKPLIQGLNLKLKGSASPMPANAEEPWQLDHKQFADATVVSGLYWWKFNFVESQFEHLKLPKNSQQITDSEGVWFDRALRRSVLGFVFLFVAALAFKFMLPTQVVQVEPLKKAEFVKLYAPRLAGSVVPSSVNTNSAPAPSKSESTKQLMSNVFKSATAVAQKSVGNTSLARKDPSKPNRSAVSDGIDLAPTKIQANGNIKGSEVTKLGGSDLNGKSQVPGGRAGTGSGGSFMPIDDTDVAVEEGLTKAEVGAVIHKHMDDIRYCHEASMIVNPKSAGKFELKFEISSSGVVNTVAVQSSTLDDKGLGDCIIQKLKTWQFPKPKGGVSVQVAYPFLFRVLGGN